MIIDQGLVFANGVSVAQAAGTYLLGNQIDTTVAGGAEGQNIYLTVIVSTAITAATAGTLQFQLASGTTAAIATDGSALVEYMTEKFVTGTTPIPAGTVLFVCALPKENGTYTPNLRYLGILAIVAAATITAGAVTAFLSEDGGNWAPLTTATL